MISWLSFGVTTGDRSFFGTSSINVIESINAFISDTPFCSNFPLSMVAFPVDEVLETFVTAVDFLVGDAAVVVFVVEDTRFTVVVVEPLVDRRVVLLVAVVLVRPMEICLLAVSLTCLSIIGDLLVFKRVFIAFATAGAVLGLVLAAVVALEALVAVLLDF